MTPLINNITPRPLYNGYPVQIGETPEHLTYKLAIQKINNKILSLGIGASTPGQVYDGVIRTAALTDVELKSCMVGGNDIYDWLNLNGAGWRKIKQTIPMRYSDVQHILMCHDDLKSNDNSFPQDSINLSNRIIEFIKLCKVQFPNLKQVDLFSRFYGGKITDTRFKSPSDYNNSFANKFAVESSFLTNHLINGVYISDFLNLYTDGEAIRSDGFYIKLVWFKNKGVGIHMDLTKEGDEIVGAWINTHLKNKYNWYK